MREMLPPAQRREPDHQLGAADLSISIFNEIEQP
jgi:hypothetical protein